MALEFWKKKSGPLPNYAWAGMGLGAAVAYSSWRRNKAEGSASKEATSQTEIAMPASLQPTYVFQDYDNTNITWPSVPAGGGRPPKAPVQGPDRIPVPVPEPARPTPAPTPAPPPAPAGKWVSVAKWTPNPVWNSTVWGIVNRLLPGVKWQTVWNAPQNAALRQKRGAPEKIQPGDQIWVPGAK